MGYEAVDLLAGQGKRVAHLHTCRGVVLEVLFFGARLFEFFGSVEGYVGATVVEQLTGVFAVDVAALALFVGTVFATFTHALVDADAQPCQGLVDVLLGAGNETVGIGILDAKNHIAAVLTGK